MKVKIIAQKGLASIVEWVDATGTHRSTIPTDSIKDGEVALRILGIGIEYGVDWADLIGKLQATPEIMREELYRRGIWTVEDLMARPQEAFGALQASYGLDLARLLQLAKRERR